eukprot:7097965-Lingulodinium_polyedra.AAC.1
MASDSAVAFSATVKELGLEALQPKLVENGWDTFMNFAFSTSDQTGKDASKFEDEVLKKFFDMENQKTLIPR